MEMARRVAKFEKVSFEQFKKDYMKLYPCDLVNDADELERVIRSIYDSIKLPRRGTKRSSGYDFFAPTNITCKYNKTVIVPTGVRIKFFEDNYDLSIFPRSSLGFKHRICMANTVCIIDNDYYGSDNEGHIMVALVCNRDDCQDYVIKAGQAYAQGIIREFCLTVDDNEDLLPCRNGGLGSTDKK